MLVCSYLDILNIIYLYVLCILFCCVYSVYNRQMSSNFAVSSLQMIKRLPAYLAKLAHFLHFVQKFIGKLSSVNDFWIGICSKFLGVIVPVYVHWTESREKELRRERFKYKIVILENTSDYNHCYMCNFIYQGCGHSGYVLMFQSFQICRSA